MNIKTKEFNVSEAEFCHVARIIYYKQLKVVIIMFSVITVISVIQAIFDFRTIGFAVGFGILLSYILAIPFVKDSSKVQCKLNFQNRTCKISDNYFRNNCADGSLNKLHFNNFIKINRESEWYFLWLTKTGCEYLPIKAFNLENDINEFEAALRNKNLME